MCEIEWLKDGIPISADSDYYRMTSETVPPNYSTNDFESAVSTLFWNLESWPQGRLDRSEDNSNYTCQSTANDVGKGVRSTTYFRVECKLAFFLPLSLYKSLRNPPSFPPSLLSDPVSSDKCPVEDFLSPASSHSLFKIHSSATKSLVGRQLPSLNRLTLTQIQAQNCAKCRKSPPFSTI